MKTIQEIKETYAIEQGFSDWEGLQSDCQHLCGEMETHMDEICIRVQEAVLEKAAENVTLISEHLSDNYTCFPKGVIANGINYSIYLNSITNPENLVR